MQTLSLPSYAKINVGLHIQAKRADGFHEIETILQQVSLKDSLHLSLLTANTIKFVCSDRNLPVDERNLCVKAAMVLRQMTGCQKGVEIMLEKRIPYGAGLGGGSSNAAVVLLGLNKLWHLGLRSQLLTKTAGTLGSDVPFFIDGGTALARGRGERLQRVSHFLSTRTILLAIPEVRIATKWAYEQANLNLTKKKKNITLSRFKRGNFDSKNIFDSAVNDIEEVVFPQYPELDDIKRRIARKAEYASLSGSGSAIYGVFESKKDASCVKFDAASRVKTFVTHSVKWGFREISNLDGDSEFA